MAIEANIQAFVVTPDSPAHMATLIDVSQSTGQVENNGCYTGCTPPTIEAPVLAPAEHVVPQVAVPAKGPELPFTGADVAELAAIGASALVVGALLTRRKHNRASR